MKNLEWLSQELTKACQCEFTGMIEVHMFKGGIGSIKIVETIKPPEDKGGPNGR